MIAYRCKAGEMVDDICWRRYGSEAAIVAVFEANPGLADLGPRLPPGVLVHLPGDAIPPPAQPVQLWD